MEKKIKIDSILAGNLLDDKIYISDGNLKLINIPTFSLPSGYTCIGSTTFCIRHCYARKAEMAYKTVIPRRYNNYVLSLRADFVPKMITLISSKKLLEYFRIHESGDFYSQEYLDKWIQIAKLLPNIKFLAFTKSFMLDFSDVPSNLIIRWSIMPDTTTTTVPKSGLYAYAGECQKIQGDGKVFQCTGQCKKDTCTHCWDSNASVHFNLH